MATHMELPQPDDFHLHLRDGHEVLKHTVAAAARQFRRAICMPNLKPPVTTTDEAIAYRERILAALKEADVDCPFEPLMTLYLTDNTSPKEIAKAKASGVVKAVKYYPAGATTNSASGVTAVGKLGATFRAMEAEGLPLLVHGEVADADVDVFDRERVFIERVLPEIMRSAPGLRIVLEHITTEEAANFVLQAPENIAATVTAHHLLINRNALLAGGLNPHHYCMPIVKRERHRQALVKAVTSGSNKFFLGTDSAPHPKGAKHSACGCAGVYTAHAALELYAEAFDKAGSLQHLEAFACRNGPTFYGLPVNESRVRLSRTPHDVPAELPFGDTVVVPFRAGEQVQWTAEPAEGKSKRVRREPDA